MQLTVFWIQMLTWAVVARALMSWFPIDQGSTLYQMLWRVTEPIIDPFRKVLPSSGMIDLSPLAAIITLIILGQVVIGLAAPTG
ncbi:MAG: YggT family protein [Dehalococcoidia bacterium]